MNSKYLKAVEGRSDGAEILRRLNIKDSDKFSKDKLEAINNTIKALDEGADMKGALDGALVIARESGLSQSSMAEFVEIPQEVATGLEDIVASIAHDDVARMSDAVAEHAYEASRGVEESLRGYVQGVYSQAVSEELQKPEFKDQVRDAIKKRREARQKA